MLNKTTISKTHPIPHNLAMGQTYQHDNGVCYLVDHQGQLINLETGSYWSDFGMGGEDKYFNLVELMFTNA